MTDFIEESLALMPGHGRQHWKRLQERDAEDALMHAHKKAGKVVKRVLGDLSKYGPSGTGWSTSVDFHGLDGKMYHLEIGGQWNPRPGAYYVYFRFIGPSFERSPLVKEVAKHMKRGLGRKLKRHGTLSLDVQNNMAVMGVTVPPDEIDYVIKHLDMIAKSWAEDVKTANVSSKLGRSSFESVEEAKVTARGLAYSATRALRGMEKKGVSMADLADSLGMRLSGASRGLKHGQDVSKVRTHLKSALKNAGAYVMPHGDDLLNTMILGARASKDPIQFLGRLEIEILKAEKAGASVESLGNAFGRALKKSMKESLSEGKAADGIMKALKKHGGSAALNDLTPMLRGIHYANIERAAKKLAKQGRVSMKQDPHDGVILTLKESGAPGPFAVSDNPPSLRDMIDSVKEQIKAPSWTYPSWALPKVALDEDE